MADAGIVRTTRSGDRFHYLWASLRALRLLDSTSDLIKISVEGPAEGLDVPSDEVIDVAEYFGESSDSLPSRVHYHQLKHSSVRIEEGITASELSKTLAKFAVIYRDALAEGKTEEVQFSFVTNRRLNSKVRQTLDDLRLGRMPSHKPEWQYLRAALGFGADSASEQQFCEQFTVDEGTVGVADVERFLADELKDYLPGGGTGSELADLLNQVSLMATYEAKSNTLTRHDLLVTLRTTENQLFPAMPVFEDLEHVIRTSDVDKVASALRAGTETKLLLTAHGGVGKSIFTGMLREELADTSLTLIFDSFAGGDYRQIGQRRHQHKVALTQLANELASKGLSTALIPSQIADEGDYVRSFENKVRKACERLAVAQPGGIISIVIDAADNAVMAAAKFGERAFVADLFEIEWPSNFRLIALCRPERKELLELPGGVTEIELSGFDQLQTLAHLRTRFPAATKSQGAQLHVLSTGNPRVQAMAIEGAKSAGDAIAAIQIATNRPGETLDALLAEQVQKVASQGHLLPDELKRLCQALATMHPTIPLGDLAKITDLSEDAIRSFAVALGRGLHFNNNSLQFRDEPTETWFTNNHSLSPVEMRDFVTRVIPCANESAYVATVLPQLLFEARMLDELVELALSDEGLPTGIQDLQAQEISRARARFALGAALRSKRNSDAALLAVKAGMLSSGHARRMKMFRANPDIAARFLAWDVVDSLCSGRELTAGWPGSNLHVEALMLSILHERHDLGRARFTASYNTISAILRMDRDAQRDLHAEITPVVIADLAFAITNIEGPIAGIHFLARWRPNDFVREVSGSLASRLADAGRTDELSELMVLAASHKYIQIGICETMFDYGIVPSHAATTALSEMLKARKKPFTHKRGPHIYDKDLRGVTWALMHAARNSAVTHTEALRILDIHLMPLGNHAGEHWSGLLPTSCLIGHALKARLSEKTLGLEDVVAEEFFERLSKTKATSDRDTLSFNQNIPQLLPWATCLVGAVMDGPTESLSQTLAALATKDFTGKPHYEIPFVRINGVADFASRILSVVPDPTIIAQFESWHELMGESLTRSQLTTIRCAARSPALAGFAIAAVNRALTVSQKDRSNADMRVDELVELARAILATSEVEARAIFNIADSEAKLVGDDLSARWYALTNTAHRLGTGEEPERAYRLLQIGETLDTDEGSDVSQLANPLFSMHPPSYYAAASRQRDRRSLSFTRLLGPIMSSASRPDGPIGALAVEAFGAPTRWRTVVDRLSPQDAARLNHVYSESTTYLRRTSDVPREEFDLGTSRNWQGSKKPKPSKIVNRFVFTTMEGWDGAFAKARWYSDVRRKVIRRALSKVPAKLAESIRAFADSTNAREEDFVVTATFASEQTPSAGLNESVAYLADVFANRFASNIATRWYDRTELTKFAHAAGISTDTILEAGFVKLGEKAHTLKHTEYFSLASHIARTLEVSEAGHVFDALAALFDDLAPPATASDGPYTSIPHPPADLATCLAGLIWAALGDMSNARRWQAAHSVLLLVQMGDHNTLTKLAKFADRTNNSAPFHDSRFPRYELHSKMWLLFALDRAASEPNASLLEPFVPWILNVIDGPPHAVNQVLAQQTLQALSANGSIEPAHGWAGHLSRRLQAEWEELDWKGQSARNDPFTNAADAELGNGGHAFFFDFRSYWARDLGQVFGTTEEAVTNKAAAISRDLTGYDETKDPRREAGVFGQDGSYPDHRSWPQEEDFAFYSAIHALLTLGANLALTLKTYKEPDSNLDEYTSWRNDFMPKRHDGRWLADRRDAPPVPAPELRIAGSPSDLWRWSLTPAAFETVVGHGTDWILVDAEYETSYESKSEEVVISSALVPHATARSYLIALQTNVLGGQGRLPTTDDDREDDYERTGPFRLFPWIDSSSFETSIDECDERGRNVVFPPPRPGPDLVHKFGLTPDKDFRIWKKGADDVFRSQVWDDTERTSRERRSGTSGQKLMVSSQFLREVLTELDMTLVVQVDLRRDVHKSSYQRKEDDEFSYVEWSTKIYLISPNGQWTEF
ncbi:hypothetical protein CVS30_12670 [Arthrobacter psychrolactophilus]|uniref:ATP-binding protein n=1 Tax=Arthrobacter psychrolactophilus TaxID=92442 RepID=A0A2V5JER9_9MICC|nr:hypothetical protein [Arthrobacter psychrolactophilus]PYI37917.1 hypothetical protein CVS30_12670 [Arthrobacter psychrolactophilus]